MRHLTIAKLFGVVVLTPLATSYLLADQHDAKTVEMKNAQDQSVGTVKVTDTGHGVQLELNLSSLPPGKHAIHIHEAAKCEGPAFETAGGHFNPDAKQHGTKNPQGPHAGDFPNFTVDAKGVAKTTLKGSKFTSLSGGSHSIIVHEKEDDMKSDPAGNAGSRLACGVIN